MWHHLYLPLVCSLIDQESTLEDQLCYSFSYNSVTTSSPCHWCNWHKMLNPTSKNRSDKRLRKHTKRCTSFQIASSLYLNEMQAQSQRFCLSVNSSKVVTFCPLREDCWCQRQQGIMLLQRTIKQYFWWWLLWADDYSRHYCQVADGQWTGDKGTEDCFI